MWAAALRKIEAVNYLFDKGADATIRDQLGRSSLHAASKDGNVAIFTKMLSLGLDANSKDMKGRTPLNFAKQFCKTEAVNFLLSKGGLQSLFLSLLLKALNEHRFKTAQVLSGCTLTNDEF